MRQLAAVALALAAANAGAATAYVSDELVLGVYADQNQQGERLTTLHSGAAVETLSSSGEYTQIRLENGATGWVKTAYLTPHEPATVRLKQLEDEVARSRAAPAGLAEAAARSEVERLQHELAATQSQLDAARATTGSPGAAAAAPSGMVPPHAARSVSGGIALAAVLVAAGCGFWLGYATLARRVRQKFGGLKVY